MEDVQELFELRLVLEPAIARLALARITPAELDRLAALADPPNVVVEPRKIRRFIDRNREFHLGLARATRNERLVRLVERTLDEMTRLVAVSYETGEHLRVVEALRSGDEQRAAAAMTEHVLMTRERVFKRELGRPLEGDRAVGPALFAPAPTPDHPNPRSTQEDSDDTPSRILRGSPRWPSPPSPSWTRPRHRQCPEDVA